MPATLLGVIIEPNPAKSSQFTLSALLLTDLDRAPRPLPTANRYSRSLAETETSVPPYFSDDSGRPEILPQRVPQQRFARRVNGGSLGTRTLTLSGVMAAKSDRTTIGLHHLACRLPRPLRWARTASRSRQVIQARSRAEYGPGRKPCAAGDSESNDRQHRLSPYPPTVDDLTAGFAIAGRDIAPAIQRTEDEYGPTAVISAFLMLADILTGVRRYGRGWMARPSAMRLALLEQGRKRFRPRPAPPGLIVRGRFLTKQSTEREGVWTPPN
jgi:hypothetical protein